MDFRYNEKIIFENTSIDIEDNKLNVILGPNGSGKSTLLKIITGEIKTNCSIQNSFKNVFYLPQNPYYPKSMTTFDYLSSIFFKNNWKWYLTAEEKQKINDVLEQIGLADKQKINIENLSGGEIQKVNIGLGLLSEADILLLDEPASNMDLINQIKILKMLKSLSSNGITSVIIMHELNLAIKYGDCFAGIDRQHKIIQKNKNEFFEKQILKQIYDMNFEISENNGNTYVQIID